MPVGFYAILVLDLCKLIIQSYDGHRRLEELLEHRQFKSISQQSGKNLWPEKFEVILMNNSIS